MSNKEPQPIRVSEDFVTTVVANLMRARGLEVYPFLVLETPIKSYEIDILVRHRSQFFIVEACFSESRADALFERVAMLCEDLLISRFGFVLQYSERLRSMHPAEVVANINYTNMTLWQVVIRPKRTVYYITDWAGRVIDILGQCIRKDITLKEIGDCREKEGRPVVPPKTRITFVVDQQTRDKLRWLAKKKGITVSELIRRIVTSKLD